MSHTVLLSRETLDDLYFAQNLSIQTVASLSNSSIRSVKNSLVHYGMRPRTKREIAIGRVRSKETRAKISSARKGAKASEETKRKISASLTGKVGWSKGLTAATDDRLSRLSKASAKAMGRPDVRDRVSLGAVARIARGDHWRRSVYLSPRNGPVYCMSSWESRRYQELDDDPTIVRWDSQPLSIPYLWEYSIHRYIPDILITYADGLVVLEEIKPLPMILRAERGDIKYARLLAKLRAGEAYAKREGIIWRLVSWVQEEGGGKFISTSARR